MKWKILIIDDDEIEIKIVTIILERSFDCKIISALGGNEGIRMIKRSKPNLVLLNLNMPEADGFEVFPKIKEIKPDLPTILYTSTLDSLIEKQASELGFTDSFYKPMDSINVKRILEILNNSIKPEKVVYKECEIGLTVIDKKIKIVELYKDGRYKLVDSNENNYSIHYPKYENNNTLNDAIEEFEELINNPKTKEIELHSFFLRNDDFILSDDYKSARSKIALQLSEIKSFVPDFILQPYSTDALCDLLEIKLPNTKIYTMKKNRPRFSSAVFESCSQLREYSAYFDDISHRNKIAKKYGLNIYKPKMIVIIGRRKTIDPIVQRRIQTDLPGLQLKTYDDVLEKAKRMKNKL